MTGAPRDRPGDVEAHAGPTEDELDHLRGDVLRGANRVLDRQCPEDDCEGYEHHLAEQYPAVSTSGAWGKYLNPVYRCQTCETAHTLLAYETSRHAGQPEWGEYPPESDGDGQPTAQRLVSERVERER